MAKKVLIISSSLHAGSNTEALAKECEKGVISAGNTVEFISLKGKTIQFCVGCFSCQSTGKCVLKDDVSPILEKVRSSDVIVFATPVYYYEMSGQLKTLLDRLNPLFPFEYSFRDIYFLSAAAEDEPTTFDNVRNGIQGWIDCFEKARLKGELTCGGLEDANSASSRPDLLQKAFEFGQKL